MSATFDLRIPEAMLTVPEAAVALRCDRNHVHALIAAGLLHRVDAGRRHGRVRLRRTEVESYASRRAADLRARLVAHPSAVRISLATHREQVSA